MLLNVDKMFYVVFYNLRFSLYDESIVCWVIKDYYINNAGNIIIHISKEKSEIVTQVYLSVFLDKVKRKSYIII